MEYTFRRSKCRFKAIEVGIPYACIYTRGFHTKAPNGSKLSIKRPVTRGHVVEHWLPFTCSLVYECCDDDGGFRCWEQIMQLPQNELRHVSSVVPTNWSNSSTPPMTLCTHAAQDLVWNPSPWESALWIRRLMGVTFCHYSLRLASSSMDGQDPNPWALKAKENQHKKRETCSPPTFSSQFFYSYVPCFSDVPIYRIVDKCQ